MTMMSYFQLIFLVLLIICCINEGKANRYRRQIPDNTNRNPAVPHPKPDGTVQMNHVPYIAPNNPNLLASNSRNNQKPAGTNNQLLASSQSQIDPARSQGYYNSPSFQPSPFMGEKPSGWFGTNHINWASNRDSELDKNKLAAERYAPPMNPQVNLPPPQREDGGAFFLEKIAKQYASKGDKAFQFGELGTRQGHGAVCTNYENFGGFVFRQFPCPLPASTGMNQNDQFCCGPVNYQFCCNAQEFSQSQRGAFAGHNFVGDQHFPKRLAYPTSTRRILAIIIPISSFIVVVGIGALVFLYFKKFRNEQHRTRRPSGAIRLEDNYSIVPQEVPIEKPIFTHDEQ